MPAGWLGLDNLLFSPQPMLRHRSVYCTIPPKNDVNDSSSSATNIFLSLSLSIYISLPLSLSLSIYIYIYVSFVVLINKIYQIDVETLCNCNITLTTMAHCLMFRLRICILRRKPGPCAPYAFIVLHFGHGSALQIYRCSPRFLLSRTDWEPIRVSSPSLLHPGSQPRLDIYFSI